MMRFGRAARGAIGGAGGWRIPGTGRVRGTIQGRLAAGFATSAGLLLVAGGLGWYALQATSRDTETAVTRLTAKTAIAERVVTVVLRELVGGLRYLQATTLEEATRYRDLARQADETLRAAGADTLLTDRERQLLEEVAARQATLEVRIASARALEALGRTREAARVVDLAARDMERVELRLQELRAAVRTSALAEMDGLRDTQSRAELALGGVVALAFGVAAFFGLSTARAVTRPLARLQADIGAIGDGDLRDPPTDGAERIPAEYEALTEALRQARARLRALIADVQQEADQVRHAADELGGSAQAAAASTQHVTTAVLDISHGAGEQLEALRLAGEAARQLAEVDAGIAEAAAAAAAAGVGIRETANASATEIERAVAVLIAAREAMLTSREEMAGLRDATASIDRPYDGGGHQMPAGGRSPGRDFSRIDAEFATMGANPADG